MTERQAFAKFSLDASRAVNYESWLILKSTSQQPRQGNSIARRLKFIGSSVLLLIGLRGNGYGCDLCAIYSATQAQGEAGKGVFAGIASQFTHFGTVQVDGKEVDNPSGQRLDSSVSQVFAGYNDRVGLQFNLPIVYRWFKRPDGLGGMDQGSVSGIGDVSLLGNFTVYAHQKKHSTVLLNLLGGVKFPTGSTARIKEEFSEVE